MRKLMVLVAVAAMFSTQVLATEVLPMTSDSLSTGKNDSLLSKKSQTQSVLGGVLGSFLGRGKNTHKQTEADKNAADEYRNEAGALGDALGTFLGKGKNTHNSTEMGKKDHDITDGYKGIGGGALGDALGSIFGNIASSKLTAEKIEGTWNYTGSKCVLESEDLMKKAGSELLVAPLEKKLNAGLERIGMAPGCYSFTFNADGSFTSNMNGRTMNGTYELKPEEKKITMNYLGGLVHTTMDIVVMNGKMGLLYDSDKLLTFASSVAAFSKSAAMKGLKAVLESYDGMKVGLEFTR